jgi:undecaprenyl-diphosphatase
MFETIILGIIQGLTEFIPVSSSAHLIIVPWLLGWQGTVRTLSFSVALHFGTLCALVLYFRKDWFSLLKTSRRKDGLIWYILIATVPAAAAGLFINKMIEGIRSPWLIICTLSLVSVLMIFTERVKKGSEGLDLESISLKDAVFIGVFQALALVPGVSRSGITIVAGMLRGFRRQVSARFSFLLSTPIVAGASVFETSKLMTSPDAFQGDIFFTGIIISAVTGYIAIKYLLRFLHSHSLNPFAYYRFLLAFVIIVAIWSQQ